MQFIFLSFNSSVLNKLVDYEEIMFHRDVANRQRKCYNEMKKNKILLERSIIIEIDFKQKVILGNHLILFTYKKSNVDNKMSFYFSGSGPKERNSEFYDHIPKSLLGFGIYFLDTNNNIQCLHMDVVFEHAGTKAKDVIHAFKFIRQQTQFKNIEKTNYIIWTDCGPHFRYILIRKIHKLNKFID